MPDNEYLTIEGLKAFKQEEDALLAEKQDTISDLSTIRSGAALGVTAVQPAALDAKQDVISDLTTIRSGATAGATALQPADIQAATELEVQRLFRNEYTITTTVTNGASTGDAAIWSEETAEIVLEADSGYILPEVIVVIGADYSYDQVTGEIILSHAYSNVTVLVDCHIPTPTNMPAKGDIITLDGETTQYRVLRTFGNLAEVMSFTSPHSPSYYGSTITSTQFPDGRTAMKYEGSFIDNYLNDTYYNSLSTNIKNAIVQRTITQSRYENQSSAPSNYNFMIRGNGSNRWYQKKSQILVGPRYCYALDLDDVARYLDLDIGDEVTYGYFMLMLFNDQYNGQYVWFSTVSSADYAYYVETYSRYPSTRQHTQNGPLRPTFCIDLSQVQYTVVQ